MSVEKTGHCGAALWNYPVRQMTFAVNLHAKSGVGPGLTPKVNPDFFFSLTSQSRSQPTAGTDQKSNVVAKRKLRGSLR